MGRRQAKDYPQINWQSRFPGSKAPTEFPADFKVTETHGLVRIRTFLEIRKYGIGPCFEIGDVEGVFGRSGAARGALRVSVINPDCSLDLIRKS